MIFNKPEISICVCTFRRPKYLFRLLTMLPSQQNDPYALEIVVVDNDSERSAMPIVQEAQKSLRVPIEYYAEPERNISLARNRAVKMAKGDLIAFIDDDEFPADDWLKNLFECFERYKVDGILGPVKPHFETEPPQWILAGRICERPTHATGTPITSKDMRTGNALLSRGLFPDDIEAFKPEYGLIGGGDIDFFERMIKAGKRFLWCGEAAVYETVTAERLERIYYLRRALARGAANAIKTPFFSFSTVKAMIAAIVYPIGLILFSVWGHGRFTRLLISYCDHIGKLGAYFGIRPVKQRPYLSVAPTRRVH